MHITHNHLYRCHYVIIILDQFGDFHVTLSLDYSLIQQT